MHVPKLLQGVGSIPDQYKGILLDQFGVLHDGKKPYPQAVEAVSELAAAGRKVLILSNSSRRAESILPKLVKMGFKESDFAGAISSGEIAWTALKERQGDFWKQLGTKCLHITWGSRGPISLKGLGLQVVTEPADAEFILAHGTEALGRGDDQEPEAIELDEIQALLQQCADKGGVPMLVANPDIMTVSGRSLLAMPGKLGQWYKGMGGEVHLLGKPDAVVYKRALEMLDLKAEEVLGVGDSVEHDIKGATAAGVDSVFIAGGIHAEDLGVFDAGDEIDLDMLRDWLAAYSSKPTFVLPFLSA
ncbi:hypothetical protein WJX73_003126 [Symbiochloris irregularis]|uniref:Uncharacterized protein n=1 Tax=Symbiochloris irregularis TaxID=706552 RepID=A0AAW1PAV2_9CHLO